MNLYFDLDTGNLVSGPGIRDQLASLTFKRGDTVPIALRFLTSSLVTELASGAAGKIGLKALGNYDGAFLAAATSWTKTGTGLTTVYNFTLNLATTELNTLLGVGAGADVPSTSGNFELEFVVDGVTTSSNTVLATVNNDIIRGDESGPTDITPGTPVNQAAAFTELEVVALPTSMETLIVTNGAVVETYTFVTSAADDYEITIGANNAACATNIYNAINSFAFNLVAAPGSSSTLVDLTANPSGAIGNGITFSGTAVTNDKIDANPTAGGVDASPGRVGTMQADASNLYVVASVTSGVPTWKKIALAAL